jgi:hypothetical protein
MKNQKNKSFDCIAMKRAAQKIIHAEIQGMTIPEQVAYFRESAKDFERKLEEAKQREIFNPNATSLS